MVTIKSQKEIEKMKEACKLTALVYDEIEKYIKPGISTMDLDNFAEKIIRSMEEFQHKKDILVVKREFLHFLEHYVFL